MKIIIVLLSSVLLMASCVPSEYADTDNSEKEGLYCKKRVYDLGVVHKQNGIKEMPFTFYIYNNSKSVIEIGKIDVECGCTQIHETPKSIAPFSKEEINGSVDISNLYGRISKPIFVNYGNNRILLLRIYGIIKN